MYRYEDMDKLTACPVCGSLRYWFDGAEWRCWNCAPPPYENVVRVDLHPVAQPK